MFDVKAAPNSNDRSLETMHLLATIGSLTKDGGRVTKATSGLEIAGLTVALVGDIVTYEDGSEAVIINGAGSAAIYGDKPLALVGSALSNGDRIVQSLQSGRGITEYHDNPIEGLFDSTYVPAPQEPNYRLAVRGATTARGGVLREPSGTWELSLALGKVAVLADLVHYPDGSTAKIASGLGFADQLEFEPLAFVGSELDNGDVITDSPEREGRASPSSFIVVKRSVISR